MIWHVESVSREPTHRRARLFPLETGPDWVPLDRRGRPHLQRGRELPPRARRPKLDRCDRFGGGTMPRLR